MTDTAILQIEANELIAEAKTLGHPTQGEYAVKLWQWSNRYDVGAVFGAETMRKAGYQPFQGYPLKRG